MSIYTNTLANIVTSAAQMQAFATFITTQLTAFGWVQTADTGQTASGSMTAGVINTASGYQIWRMADSLQGTYPVFVKFEFGAGSAAAYPSLWITIGTGSNGSGTITTILVPRTQITTGNGAGTAYTCYMSGATDRINMALFASSVTAAVTLVLGIERTKDVNGADTSDGVIVIAEGNSVQFSAYAQFTGTIRAAQTAFDVPVFSGCTSLANGGNVGLLPILPFGPVGVTNPGNNFLVYYGPDLAQFNPISTTIHGSSHTYMPLALTTPSVSTLWATSYLAMLYE